MLTFNFSDKHVRAPPAVVMSDLELSPQPHIGRTDTITPLAQALTTHRKLVMIRQGRDFHQADRHCQF